MDIYAMVTDKIITLLENGVVPWRRPWTSTGLPRNLVSKKPYRGVNVFLLSASKYVSPFWLTMRQANELGGHIRKGEESTAIVFWKIDDVKQSTEDLEAEEPEEKTRRRFLLRFYRVWNLEQVELPEPVRARFQVQTQAIDPIAEAERIIAEMPNPPAIEYHGSLAFYRPTTDTVVLPPRDSFLSPEGFYQSIYHEILHSSGHPKRLARPGITESIHFGSERYSREELVSELGAAFLCAAAGIDNATLDDHAAYLKGWLDALKADKRAIVQAAAQAQKAADYILDRAASE